MVSSSSPDILIVKLIKKHALASDGGVEQGVVFAFPVNIFLRVLENVDLLTEIRW